MKRFLSIKLLLIIVTALALGFFDLPNSIQAKVLPNAPEWISQAKVHLGLDLQGGSQLDYKVNLDNVPQDDRESIIEGVLEVINKRVNGLGVSEPNIYRSSVGDEEHIVVELAGIKDLELAKATVGKTIQLEFKEPKEQVDPQEEAKSRAEAQGVLDKILQGADFAIVGQEAAQGNPSKIKYSEDTEFKDIGKLGTDAEKAVANLNPGDVVKTLVNNDGAYSVDETGQLVQNPTITALKLLDKKSDKKYDRESNVSHILIAYQGAQGADTATKSEEEAKAKAEELRNQILAGGNFAELAQANTDDGSTLDKGGKLPISINADTPTPFGDAFRDEVLKLEKAGDVSEVIKSNYGFHVIKADEVKRDISVTEVKVAEINFSLSPDPWQASGITGEHFVHADVEINQFGQPQVSIRFNDEGAKLFEELTGKLAPGNKRLAIFVGGEYISAPTVQAKIAGGQAQITNVGTYQEAKDLARDLNTGAIPAPIILTGQYTIGATLGETALNQSVTAGLIGLLVLALWMIVQYRLPGLLAVFALFIYSIILLFLIKGEMNAGVAVTISILIFGFIINTILKSKDSGAEKFISFIIGTFGFFFFSFLLKTPIVLTLAGVAGVILSIGVAVDANILIFERMKEELRDGHDIKSSIEHGFERAWSSIRDSNFSSLITCAILAYFGSSIIRGFAINLAAGILISMFSAITLTKTFLVMVGKSKLGANKALFGVAKQKEPLKIVEKSKVWFGISGVFIAISIASLAFFGLKFGIDFQSGTLMEVKFEQEVSKEQLTTSLHEVDEIINAKADAENAGEGKINLKTASVVSAGESNRFVIKALYLTNEQHDAIKVELESKLGKFEEPRFTTVGPVVGKTLKQKALVAIVLALIMIIIYIAFAFRKVPKSMNPWSFGGAAFIALVHDLVIVIGLFSILGATLDVEVDALFITALLTVLGFSIHDTIVVFDRIRENLKFQASGETLTETVNKALTQTMARSINTSLSTLITLAALLIFGSASIFYFILALFAGITVGTYSSIFIASLVLVAWQKRKG